MTRANASTIVLDTPPRSRLRGMDCSNFNLDMTHTCLGHLNHSRSLRPAGLSKLVAFEPKQNNRRGNPRRAKVPAQPLSRAGSRGSFSAVCYWAFFAATSSISTRAPGVGRLTWIATRDGRLGWDGVPKRLPHSEFRPAKSMSPLAGSVTRNT